MPKKKKKPEMDKPSEYYKEQNPEIPDPKYSKEELDYRSFIISRVEEASQNRDSEQDEFDGMDYLTWYESNAKSAYSYVRPKKHPEDTRIVTGTTQEKENTMISTLLNYNLEPSIEAFDDKDFHVVKLGETMESLVKKSREIENYEEVRPLIYKELFDQGTCFVEEILREEWRPAKELNDLNWSDGVKVKDIKWTERLEKVYAGCQVNLLSGLNVYLGNIREFFIHKQPFVFTVDIVPYEEAKQMYGQWERWDYVPRKIRKVFEREEETTTYRNWTLQDVDQNMVEIIKYQDKPNNEFQIFLNGVMMLPTGFPLSAISPSGEYTISKGDVEPISKFFAYSKSIPTKLKVDQAVLDELYRLIVLKTQKSFSPPMANNSNRNLSREIFLPGKITQDIRPDELQPIGDTAGVTQPEFNVFELVKKIVDEKSVTKAFEGQAERGRQTATEIMENKRQSMQKLGLQMFGVINLERQIAALRIPNIIQNWTKPIDEKVDEVRNEIVNIYKSVVVDSEFENGQQGKKIVEFTENLPERPEMIMAEEDMMTRARGYNVRKIYLNPKELSTVKYNWHIIITPTEKETSELKRVLLIQNIQDLAAIFGIQSLNMEHLKERVASAMKEDPGKLFLKQQPVLPPGLEGEVQLPGQRNDMSKQVAQAAQKPSLNTLANELSV